MKMLDFALGFIETRGLVAAIEAADAALKTAEVKLIAKEISQDGLVTIKFIGDITAVRASIEAGSATAARKGKLILSHIISQPAAELEKFIFLEKIQQKDSHPKSDVKPFKQKRKAKNQVSKPTVITPSEISDVSEIKIAENEAASFIAKQTTLPTSDSENEFLIELQAMSVQELRRYARSIEGLTIFGRQISMANKEKLIAELMNAKFPKQH